MGVNGQRYVEKEHDLKKLVGVCGVIENKVGYV